MTPEALDAIRQRHAKITPGDWEVLTENGDEGWEPGLDIEIVMVPEDGIGYCPIPNNPDNAEFIAHAPTDIAALLAALDDRDARIARALAIPPPWFDRELDHGYSTARGLFRAALSEQDPT